MKRNRGVMPESFRDCLSYGEQVAYLYKMISEVEKEEGPAGPPGATPIVSASATVDSNTGVPSVDVVKSGSDLAPSFGFNFHNLRGERGLPGTPGSAGSDGVGITSIAFKETDASGNNIYTVNLSDSTSYDIIVPRGPQGVAGQSGSDGRDGVDGVGVTSIVFKETDANGNNVYTVNLSDSTSYDITCPRGPQGPSGSGGSSWTLKKTVPITSVDVTIEESLDDPFITDNDDFLLILTYWDGNTSYVGEYVIDKMHYHKIDSSTWEIVKDDESDVFRTYMDPTRYGRYITKLIPNNRDNVLADGQPQFFFLNLRLQTYLLNNAIKYQLSVREKADIRITTSIVASNYAKNPNVPSSVFYDNNHTQLYIYVKS